MENSEQRPSAALVNREWYAAAKSVLRRDQLGSLLIKAIEYVLAGGDGVQYDTMVETVFAMVKPALDSDIVKYHERCIRNAQNARAKRVGASGSEWEQIQLQLQQQLQPQQQQQLQNPLSLLPKRSRERNG